MIKIKKILPSTKIELALSVRSINILKKANWLIGDKDLEIKTIKDLSLFSEVEIRMLKGSGETTSLEMLDALSRAGLGPSVKSNRLNSSSWSHVFLNKPELIKKIFKNKIPI